MHRISTDKEHIKIFSSHIKRKLISSNISFHLFATISFDKMQSHDKLNHISRSMIRNFHRSIYKSAVKYTEREWLKKPHLRPSIFSIIEDKDKWGNPVFPHIHTIISIDKSYEEKYIDILEFYIDKYGIKMLGVRPHTKIIDIYDLPNLIGYMCKNVDSNYALSEDMIIEGKLLTQIFN